MPFIKNVTMTKRNHVYFGATQSHKVAVTLEETSVDLVNIYNQLNVLQNGMDFFANEYLDPSGRLKDLSSQVSVIEDTLDKLSYIQATQEPFYSKPPVTPEYYLYDALGNLIYTDSDEPLTFI